MPAYIAVSNIIYDISSKLLWTNGTHYIIHLAGNDLTAAFIGKHDDNRMSTFPIVGHLILPVLTTITVSPVSTSVNVNSTTQLTATCKDQNGNTMTCPTLTWTSSDPSKATVNSSGLVTGVLSGLTNVTARSGSITSNSSTVTVSTTPSGITVTNPTPGI